MLNSQPLISIIIPAYNYAHTLERAIVSVYKQMDKDCELLVINDGSTDNTSELLDNLSKVYSKAIIINKTNGGAASARNTGIRMARGEFLIFLDADDEWCPDALHHIRQHLQHHDTQFVIGDYYTAKSTTSTPDNYVKKRLHQNKKPSHSDYHRLKAYLIDKTISLCNGACVMHKSIFETYLYPEKFRNSEDIPVFAHAISNFKCSVLNHPLAVIHKHTDSLRHNHNFADQVGLDLVEEIFSNNRIKPQAQTLKEPFLTQRLLSLSRVSHENKQHGSCIHYFLLAYKTNIFVTFKWGYLKKFMISLFKEKLKKSH